MTEYDFSPEAYEAYNRKQRSIDRWRQDLTRHQPANPFKPIPGEHSADEDAFGVGADDFVRVDGLSPNESLPNGAHAVPRASRQPRHEDSKGHLKKGKKELKRSQSMQRPPLVAHNPPPQRPFGGSMTALGVYPNPAPVPGQYGVPPVPPLNQRGYQQPQQFPAAIQLPHGTATRSYSSPAHPNVVAAHQMAAYQQYPYVNNIYAPQPQPQKPQPQPYSRPSSSSQNPHPSPPLYPTSRHFGVQMPGGLASQSSMALSSTTTIVNPNGVAVVGQAPTTILYPGQNQTTPQTTSKSHAYPSVQPHPQQQQQPQTYYIPQALPGGGMMYVPQVQGMTSPPAVIPMNAGAQAHAQAQAQAQWGYFGMPPPPAPPVHKEEKTGFFGGLFHSGSRKDKTKKMSRRESF